MLKITFFELLLFILLTIFSIWLMFSTFGYSNGSMYISSKAWSDFASHIPLIRSFSFGDNFPPQFPLYPGPSIHYHFLFYAFVGFLENIGLNIALALNMVSALGFLLLLVLIYIFNKTLLKSKVVGLLSVIFFLFNGSLGFTFFLDKHPFTATIDGFSNFVNSIINNREFTSFGPYDGGIISAFWNLNIFTNQRHLGLSFAISLLMIVSFLSPVITGKRYRKSLSIFLGVILGLLFFFHLAVFMMTIIILAVLTILFPFLRHSTFIIFLIGALLSLPQYLYLQAGGSGFKLLFRPGYLISDNLSLVSFLNYWFYNLGLHFIFIPLGFLIAPLKIKKIALAFFAVFIIGNLFQFSPEMAANHKLFNYPMLFGVGFSAFFIKYLWGKQDLLKLVVIVLFFLLTFTGVIDFFPIRNDLLLRLPDYPQDPDISWIISNTPKDAVFLNSSYLYNPASIAGRKIFSGWPYFVWGTGYDADGREKIRKDLFGAENLESFCSSIKEQNLSYMILDGKQNQAEIDVPINRQFFDQNFTKSYQNSQTRYIIFNLRSSCHE